MRAMVFGAGLGTRLRPLTDQRPKPGVPVANRPLASLAVAHLASAGARHVVMNTFHLGERLPALMAAHVPAGLRVTYVQEARLLNHKLYAALAYCRESAFRGWLDGGEAAGGAHALRQARALLSAAGPGGAPERS